MKVDTDRCIAMAAAIFITMLAFGSMIAWQSKLSGPRMASGPLEVTWIHRAPGQPTPVAADPHRIVAPDRTRRVKARARPTEGPPAPTQTHIVAPPPAPIRLNLDLPEPPQRFTNDPLRKPPASFAVEHLRRFAVRDRSMAGRSLARDCAELRAALARGANSEVIVRSMLDRGCTL